MRAGTVLLVCAALLYLNLSALSRQPSRRVSSGVSQVGGWQVCQSHVSSGVSTVGCNGRFASHLSLAGMSRVGCNGRFASRMSLAGMPKVGCNGRFASYMSPVNVLCLGVPKYLP